MKSIMWFLAILAVLTTVIIDLVIAGVTIPIESTANPKHFNITFLQDFCSITKQNNNYSLACLLQSEDVFSFVNFRNWSKSHDNSSNIRLNIECQNGGSVVLPWPYRSYYLVSLVIKDCVLKGHKLESNRTELLQSIEDRLEWIEIINCEEYQTLEEWKLSINNPGDVTKEFECGPLNIVHYVKRNLTSVIEKPSLDHPDFGDYDSTTQGDYGDLGYDVFSDSPLSIPELDENTAENNTEDLEEAIRQVVVGLHEMRHDCQYSDWKYYENSDRLDIGKFHLKGLTANGNFPKLKVINFTRTYQHFVQNELLKWRLHFPKLEILDMSYCSVSEFNFQDYSSSKVKRGYINLQYNNISSLGLNEINSFKRLKSTIIDVRNNPYHCDCAAMSDFVEFLQRHENLEKALLQSNYTYLWELQCTSPNQFTGRLISELTKDILCNLDASVYIELIVILSVVVVVMIVIIIVIAKYRREIRILVFTRLHIVLPCEPVQDNSAYQYDAFLSYSSNDEDWVINNLAKDLEDPRSGLGLHLCLHHRDFQVGECICDNIISGVDKSRHTVLIVSQNFLRSEWCVFEFREALRKSLLERRKHMVIVLLDDVELTHVESDFRRCLQTMTYIKANDALFWDRMKYALGRKCHNYCSSVDNKVFEIEKSRQSVDNLSPINGTVKDIDTLPQTEIQDCKI